MNEITEVKSRSFRTLNSVVTVHAFSSGTVIFNVVATKDAINRVAIWMSPEELQDLGRRLIEVGSTICQP